MRNAVFVLMLFILTPARALEYSFPVDGGWYQLQSLPGYETVCATGDVQCNIPNGQYLLVNHTIDEGQNGHRTYKNLSDNKECSADKFNVELPTDGWFQLQSLPNYDTVCFSHDDSACSVGPGEYVMINHKPREFDQFRENVLVGCDGVTFSSKDLFRVGLTPMEIPNEDVDTGSYDKNDFTNMVKPLPLLFWEHDNGLKSTSVAEVDGKRSFVINLNDESRIPSTRAGGGAEVSPARQIYRVVQRLQFDPDFSFGGAKKGGKLGFGIAGGSRKSGGSAGPFDEATQTGFSSRIMWRDEGELYSYTYDANTYGYGHDEPLEYQVERGEWFDTAMEVTMNSAGGAADGRLRIWVNGVLVLDKSDYEWFGRGNPQVDSLILFVFHGAGSQEWSPTHDSQISITDVFHGGGAFPF